MVLIAIYLKGRIMKAITSIVLSQRQRGIYDQGGCWLWEGRKGKNLIFFKTTLLQVSTFGVFYLFYLIVGVLML